MDDLLSPDNESFSTPPSTPGNVMDQRIRPSLSRRGSRPTSLHIQKSESGWNRDVVLDQSTSPAEPRRTESSRPPPAITQNHDKTPRHTTNSHSMDNSNRTSAHSSVNGHVSNEHITNHHPNDKSLNSPCFIHSYLDKNVSLTDWLRSKQNATHDGGDVNVAKALQQNGLHPDLPSDSPHSISPHGSISIGSNEDDNFGGNLTKQLAETAVTVREMSKQLGRARVKSNIQSILIITKARDNRLIKLTRELAIYLMLKRRSSQARGHIVYVDSQLRHSRRFDAEGIERDYPELFHPFPRKRTSSSNSLSSMSSNSAGKEESEFTKEEGQLRYWTSDMCSHSPHLFDFVVTLGGDGTVLFTSWLFQRIVPPVLPFALGSLGFLTNFDFSDHISVMDSAIDNGIRVNLRMRFTCTVYRAVAHEAGKGRKAVKKGHTGEIMMKNVEAGGWEALEGGWSGGNLVADHKVAKDKEIMCFTTRPVETFEVLNDLVVDRGPSPYVSLLELFGDEHHMTTVQADGLTVSTPTGSTAYSLSAGGSLVHPEIPAILITPICPHTLSFRPMLLPDSMELRICVPFNSRSTAWASFDGRGRVELKQGDHIKVTASKYPFPTVCADKQSTDWFHAISRTLKWNERERQKSFVVVEEGPQPKKRKPRQPTEEAVDENQGIGDEEDEVSDEEEEDKFDIDDSSPEAKAASNTIGPTQETVGQEKAKETIVVDQVHKMLDPLKHRRHVRSRSRSGVRSGVDTPDRFMSPHPHPPNLSPRHVEFALEQRSASPAPSNGSTGSSVIDFVHNGMRDDLHTARKTSGKSRIPKDRDLDLDGRTPTVAHVPLNRLRGHLGHTRSRSADPGHRAFAVWGQDESDSNASDSDA